FPTVLAECQDAFGEGVLPLYLPVTGTGGVSGLIRLLAGTVRDYSVGSRTASAVDGADAGELESARGTLIEGIITESEDETLMDRFLSGETVPTDVLIADLLTAVARGSFYPVLAVSA